MIKVKKQFRFEPDFAVAPGETLEETIQSLDMSKKELAARAGLTEQSINRILKGDQPITYETASKLELVTGVPAKFWNNLEALYREQLAKIAERQRLEKQLEWLKTIPCKELGERKCIEFHADKTELLRNVLKFYGVSSVEAWGEIWGQPAIAARRSKCFESHRGPASAWIRQGELQAHKMHCQPYEKSKFIDALKKIRCLTKEDVSVFETAMKQLCAEAGVAVSLVREMKNVPWNGATKWLSPHKAMILLNLRGKGEDHFWFSFFHEAGHVLHDSKKDLMINDGSHQDDRERRADNFAGETLIPARYNSLIENIRSKQGICSMAEELNISPGIVAGRFQYLTKRWTFFKGLIRKFEWENATVQ